MNQISKRCVTTISILCVCAAIGCTSAAPDVASAVPEASSAAEPSTVEVYPIPEWVTEHWTALIGTWIADNGAYKSETETTDAYGLEWSWGLGNQSLVGRLFGLVDGEEVGTYWQFREFWHPLEGRLVTQQWGWGGAFGTGSSRRTDDGGLEMVQTFSSASGGTSAQTGHRMLLEGDEHTTSSFEIDKAGAWKQQRTYVWKRQPAPGD